MTLAEEMKTLKYSDGRIIHAGDRIFYNGQPGTIAFVAAHNEYSANYPKQDWPSIKTGFMIIFTNGARMHLDEPDEHFSKDKDESMEI